MLRASIGHKPNEVLFVIFLYAKNEDLTTKELGEGTVSQASAFPRKIVEKALKQKGTSIILAHNHPCGIAEPSEHDESITTEIQKALALVEISLQDHIILAVAEYFSFIPNQLDSMHKIVIPGVHEIAALVAKIACARWLGINRL